ncbi:YhdP family protein [Entomobacter blattae]|uniref:Uncharacterized protein n=1 Tax=Entomobacter blattae TaxID=2762277 RepID=A0A7H1NNH8_9PROT|nr:DUF3971 domain-containing protein [Entomobacter blattae]QNT77338.1 hypothetical protein JGUZn3_00710 [Entomobacter blattae]
MIHDTENLLEKPTQERGVRAFFLSPWWLAIKVVVLFLLSLLGVPLIALAVLIFRLGYGPLDVSVVAKGFFPVVIMSGQPGKPPAASLTIGRVFLNWNGFHYGLKAPFSIKLVDAKVLDAKGQVVNLIKSSEVSLRLRSLLKGAVSINSINIQGADIHLLRQKNGDFTLDVPGGVADNAPPPKIDFSRFKLVQASDIHAIIRDEALGYSWNVTKLDIKLNALKLQKRIGFVGDINVALNFKDVVPMSFHAHGSAVELTNGETGLKWQISLDPVNPAAFVSVYPQMEGLKSANLPIGFKAEFILAASKDQSQFVLPSSLQATVTVGTGYIQVGDGIIPMIDGATEVEAKLPSTLDGALKVTMKKGLFHLASSKFPQDRAYQLAVKTSGSLSLPNVQESKLIDMMLKLDTPRVDLARIMEYWPRGISQGARDWVEENLVSGQASNFHMDIGLGSHAGWENLDIASLGGHVDAKKVKVYWMRPIPPLEDIQAKMQFVNKNKILITFFHATQIAHPDVKRIGSAGPGKIQFDKGTMEISGLMDKVQTGVVHVPISGDVRDILAILDEPKFHLFSRSAPLPLDHPQGKAKVALFVQLPLVNDIHLKDVKIRADTYLTDVSIQNIVMNRPLEGGNIHLVSTTENLALKGNGKLSGIPSSFSYAMKYAKVPSGSFSQQADVQMRLSRKEVARELPFLHDYIFGNAALSVQYRKYGSGHIDVVMHADLSQANIVTPFWEKPYHVPGTLQAVMHPVESGGNSFDSLIINAPGLRFSGRVMLSSRLPENLVEGDYILDHSQGYIRVAYPVVEGGGQKNGSIHITLNAQHIDASSYLQKDSSKTSSGFDVPPLLTGWPAAPQRPWDINAYTRDFLVEPEKIIRDVRVQVDSDGRRISRIYSNIADAGGMRLLMFRERGFRPLYFQMKDLGHFFGSIDFIKDFRGGPVDIHGYFDDEKPTAPFTGRFNVGPFHMMQAPRSLLLANNLSIYGWLLGPKPPQFDLNHIHAELELNDNIIQLKNGQAGNSSLGATFKGPIDLHKGEITVDGTIVPAFIINTLPGKLPLIGELFSPEEGGGLISATFDVRGPLNDMNVHVHPFSVLLPGILRELIQ